MPKPKKRMPFAWRPVMIYIAIVFVAGAGLVIWERAYEAKQESVASPPPEAAAKNLVEGYVGAGTVQSVRLDRRTGTLTLDVKDVVTDPKKTPAQNQELLSAEGTQAADRILGFVTFKHVVLRLMKDGKLRATVRADPGQTPHTEFVPDFK
ncbi:MAG TPA: hypothetical protein VFP86_03115 [bacterium]|nr:hypothetical protein [bacterium]